MLSIFFLFAIQIFAEDCKFRSYSLVTVDSAVKCLRHLPYKNSPKEVNQTLETLETYFNQYAYRDTTADIPDPFKKDKFDIVKAINEIKGTSFKDGFEFHQAIANAVSKLNDPHTIYRYPCSNAFAYVFPYNFEVQVPNPSEPNDIKVVVTKSVVKGVTETFIRGGGANILGSLVTTMVLPDIKSYTTETPANTIARWSREHVSLSRTPAAKFNYALDSQLTVRVPSMSPPPEPISLRVTKGLIQRTVKIPFYAMPFANTNNVTDFFNSICPARSLVTEDQMDLFKLEDEEPEEDFEQVIKEHSEDVAFTMVYDRLKNDDVLKQMITAERRTSFQLERDSLPQIHHLKKVGMIRNKSDDARDLLESARKATGKTNGGDSLPQMEVLVSDENIRTGLIHDWKLGVMHIVSFAPSTDSEIASWIGAIVDVLVKTKKAGYKMIIDMRGNSGGLAFLGSQLYHLLFPNMFPINMKYSFVEGPANNAVIKSIENDAPLTLMTNYSTLEEIPHLLDLPTRTIIRDISGEQREQNWTQQIAINTDRYFDYLFKPFIPEEYIDKQLFDANDLLFVTNGECGSTCSQFLKHVKESQQAKVIGFGGALNQQTMPHDIGSFAGGSAISTDAFENSYVPGIKKFPRRGTSLSWVYGTGYSFDWNKPQKELEYKIVEPDEVYPIYPNVETQFTEEGYVSMAQAVKYMFDKCFDFQVIEADKCSPMRDQHMLFGYRCKGGEFNRSMCEFRRCEDGYYTKPMAYCLKTPKIAPLNSTFDYSFEGIQNTKEETKQKQKEGNKSNLSAIVSISIGCVCGALVIVGATVLSVIAFKKKKARKQTLPEEKPLIA